MEKVSTEPLERLKKFRIFEQVGGQALRRLVASSDWLGLRAGAQLPREGDNDRAVFLVVSGSLGVFVESGNGGKRQLATIPEGETAGEMSLLTGESHSALLVALRDTELLRIGPKAFDGLITRHPRVLFNLLKIVVRRLRETTRGAYQGFASPMGGSQGETLGAAETTQPTPKPDGTPQQVELTATVHAKSPMTGAFTHPIWNRAAEGTDLNALLTRIETTLFSLRTIAETIQATKNTSGQLPARGHNKPPELLEAPELDPLEIEAGIAAVAAVRDLLPEATPKPSILDAVIPELEIAARAVCKFAAWIAVFGWDAARKYIGNILDAWSKQLGKTLATPHGIAAWSAVITVVMNGKDADLRLLTEIVRAVRTSIVGH